MSRKFSVFFTTLALSLLLAISIIGQDTAGEIQGTVKDPNGAVVPNAQVVITGVDVGYNRTIQTDDQGFYRATRVPPGKYKITVSAISGFAEQTRTDIQVSIGNATTIDVAMAIAGSSNVVNVTSDSGVIVDATEAKAQHNLSARQIDALPKGTNFTSLLKTTATVRAEPLGGQFSINGATGPENSFIIDGQETQNFRSGLINVNNDIPYQAVQEIQVKSSGFEAEFGGATGGVINAVTKGGTNEFRGEFGIQFNTPKFDARPRDLLSNFQTTSVVGSGQGVEVLGRTKDRGTNSFPTGSLGGPIIKDKMWFFGIWSPRYLNTYRDITFVQGFGPTRRPVVNTAAQLVAANLPITEEYRNERTINFGQFRIDAQPFDKLRIATSYTWNPVVDHGQIPTILNVQGIAAFPTNTIISSQSFVETSNGVLAGAKLANQQGGRQNSNNFRFEATYTPTSNIVMTGRYTRGFLNQKLASYFIPTTTRIRCRDVTGTNAAATTALAAQAGCATGFQNSLNNAGVNYDVSIRDTADANVSYLVSDFGGRHEFKGGFQYSRIFNTVDLGTGINGGVTHLYYGTNDLADSFLCNASWAPVVNISRPTLPSGVSVIGVGCNQEFRTTGKAQNTANSFFIQDKWQPTNRLTLSLGLRAEQEKIPAFNESKTNLEFSFLDKISPRIGAAYALTEDGKTKLSGFYGWFYDRLKFDLPRGSFGGDFYHVDFFYITSDHPNYNYYNLANIRGNYVPTIGGQCPIAQSSSTLVRCDEDFRIPSNLVNSADLGGGAVDPNLKPYKQAEFTLEFQREVARSTVMTVRYLNRNLLEVVEDAGIINANGSEAYIIGNPGKGLHAETLRAAGYNAIITPKRKYNAVQFETDTRFIKNLGLNLNYTWSRLEGNYNGLGSPDENGRTTPNVNRDFDLPFVGFSASGQEVDGLLGLDRTHVFKASGTYSFDWMGSKTNSTDMSFFTTLQSGTPQTTFVTVMGIPIPETQRGDMGRTPMFTETDLNFSHRYRFGSDNKFTLIADLNILNAFNQVNVLGFSNSRSSPFFSLSRASLGATYPAAINLLTSQGVIPQLRAAEANFTASGGRDSRAALDQTYGQPAIFNVPRTMRFGFRLLF